MATKEPVLLLVLIQSDAYRWWVSGVSLLGDAIPLLRSDVGNLNTYVGLPFDEQVSFLRHRLCGVLQRGCDRLWGLMKKPCKIVIIADHPFAEAASELTSRVAEHFVLWMTSPGVAFVVLNDAFSGQALDLAPIAGELAPEHRVALKTALPELADKLMKPDLWELVPTKSSSAGASASQPH